MKKRYFVGLIIVMLSNFAYSLNGETLREFWIVDNLSTPESVVYDSLNDLLYVSNINGDPADKDRNGYISKINLKGEIVEKKWIATLDAPKGMAISENYLYVADINQLVMIDINLGKIVARFNIKDSEFLNDVTSDKNGNIYITDSSSSPGIIYKFLGGKITKWLVNKNLKRPNGIAFYNDEIFVGSFANGMLYKINPKTNETNEMGKFINAIDGLTFANGDKFFLSNWFGKIVMVKDFSNYYELTYNFPTKINSADILYLDYYGGILLIPTFFADKLIAYKIISD